MGDLRFELFKGIGKIKPIKFYTYKLMGKGEIDNVYQVINRAKYALHSRNKFKAVFVKEDKLYTLEKFNNITDLDYADIIFDIEEVLNIEDNREVYSKVVEYYINNNLRSTKVLGKYSKYIAKNTDEIVCNTVLTRNLKDEFGCRGLDFEEFKDFNKLFTNSNVLFMDQNFRSSGNIVYLANKFKKINKNRYDKNIFTINKDGAEVITVDVNSKEDQMDYVIETLSKCSGNYDKYAILYRNNISAIEVADKLNNIPFYVKEELNSFLYNFIERDILNLIEFAKNQLNR